MSVFSKILENLGKTITKELDKSASKEAAKEASKNTIKGKNFTTTIDKTPSKTDYNIKMEVSPHTRNLAQLKDKDIFADLEYLASKHPEMFAKPSEVFRLMRDIKDNPTHFYQNNRLDASLIVKRLENQKIGKMVVKKDSGQVLHATKVKEKDLDRLQRVDKKHSGDKSLALSKTSSSKAAEQEALNLDSHHNSTKIPPQKQESTTLINDKIPPMMRE